jgi:hypothetical protein
VEEVNKLESLYAYSRNNKIKVGEGWFQRNIGEILLNIDDQHISESEHWIQHAIETDQRNGMMFALGYVISTSNPQPKMLSLSNDL